MKKILILMIISLSVVGCKDKLDDKKPTNENKPNDTTINDNNIISSEIVKDLMDNSNVIIIDVRSKEEYQEKHIASAINIPLNEIDSKISRIVLDKNQNIVVYCLSGARSSSAKNILKNLGYSKVFDLGSINNWKYEYEN